MIYNMIEISFAIRPTSAFYGKIIYYIISENYPFQPFKLHMGKLDIKYHINKLPLELMKMQQSFSFIISNDDRKEYVPYYSLLIRYQKNNNRLEFRLSMDPKNLELFFDEFDLFYNLELLEIFYFHLEPVKKKWLARLLEKRQIKLFIKQNNIVLEDDFEDRKSIRSFLFESNDSESIYIFKGNEYWFGPIALEVIKIDKIRSFPFAQNIVETEEGIIKVELFDRLQVRTNYTDLINHLFFRHIGL